MGESTIADAIMDRLINMAFRIGKKSKKSLREKIAFKKIIHICYESNKTVTSPYPPE